MKRALLLFALVGLAFSSEAQTPTTIHITNNSCQTMYAYFSADDPTPGACTPTYHTSAVYTIPAGGVTSTFDISGGGIPLSWITPPSPSAYFIRARFVSMPTSPTWGADINSPCMGVPDSFPVKATCGKIQETANWSFSATEADIQIF